MQHPAFGLGFMVSVMLLETVLYVIRTTVPPKLHYAVEQRAQEKRQAAAAAAAAGEPSGSAAEELELPPQLPPEPETLSSKKDK